MQYNIRGLLGKQRDLTSFLSKCTIQGRVDVVILSETWLTKESESRVNVPGYEYYGVPRKSKKGGGVGFLVRNTVAYKPQPKFINNE